MHFLLISSTESIVIKAEPETACINKTDVIKTEPQDGGCQTAADDKSVTSCSQQSSQDSLVAVGKLQWLAALDECSTWSRLHVLLGVLDTCVKWEKSAENAVSATLTSCEGSCITRHLITHYFTNIFI